ncbi:asparagine synthase-related protein [Salinibacter ruber]|nr:asparagine synthase-related protein [Salinibacter ruber]MCS4223303.1 asparagine synthase (glutamine-hydrolyzing) [Salinibacter ruber]
MSGLCGCIHWTNRPGHAQTAAQMADAAAYRGPDGIEAWSGARASLTHLALNVTAADERESQPLVENDLVLVADARIDDRSTLQSNVRRQLRTGSPTDADLILAAYRRWGADCPAHLIGDFAFAIWDLEERRLFAARDPMGMRPLHYCIENDRLLFGSDVKQLLAAPEVPAELNESMAAAYLAGNFNDLRHTFYNGIRALPPGHALHVTPEQTDRWQYWALDPDERIEYARDREYIEHFRELFTQAVQDRLRSPHPVGLMLSGGLDSGSVASMAGWLHEQEGNGLAPLRTYSWAFETLTQCDERFISNEIVERYGLSSTPIDAEAAPLLSVDPYIGPDRDSPYVGGFHGLEERCLRRAKSEGVRRMMTGHRGDLVAGGWHFDYLRLLKGGQWRKLCSALQAHAEQTGVPLRRTIDIYLLQPLLSSLWPEGRAETLRRPAKKVYQALRSGNSPADPFPPWVRSAFADQHTPLPAPPEAPDVVQNAARRGRYRWLFMPTHMRVATAAERHAARHGMEMADPWSDLRLIEFAFAVPPAALCRNGQNKWLVRESMRDVMPESVRKHAQKISPYPLHRRALKDYLFELAPSVIEGVKAENIVNSKVFDARCNRYQDGSREDKRLWHTLTFGLWLEEHL